MVARCFWGISLQVVRRIVIVGSRWCWLGDGCAVLFGNAIAGFHGGVAGLALVVHAIAGFHVSMVARSFWGMSLQVVKVALSCRWYGAVFLGNEIADR